MAVRIVTDSACDLPPELERELDDWGVHVIPFVFHFGQDACLDKTMSMETFLNRALETWPTTAAPAFGAYTDAFQRIVSQGDQALCLTITGNHSSAYSTAALAAQEFEPDQVAVVDSHSLSLGEGLLALAAVRAARAGATLQEIVAMLRDVAGRIRFFIGLDTVDYVVRGGRASRLVGLLAGLLRLRPILSVEEGELTLKDKARTRAHCKERLLALVNSCLPVETLGVMHAAAAREAEELAETLARVTGWAAAAIPVVEVGMVLATHAGPGGLGIVAVPESREAPGSRRKILGVELPRVELPHVELPHIDLPRIRRDG